MPPKAKAKANKQDKSKPSEDSKKLKAANAGYSNLPLSDILVKVRHILCEKQSKGVLIDSSD
jgi:hypothetical protein